MNEDFIELKITGWSYKGLKHLMLILKLKMIVKEVEILLSIRC